MKIKMDTLTSLDNEEISKLKEKVKSLEKQLQGKEKKKNQTKDESINIRTNKENIDKTSTALLNMLEDLIEEKKKIEKQRKATLNILDDAEKSKKEIEELYKSLKQLDKMKNIFLSMTSHELKSPIVPIITDTQILLDNSGKNLTKNQIEGLENILRNIKNLDYLIGDIFDISKIQSGKLKLFLKESDLSKLIENSVDDVIEIMKEKGINLKYERKILPKIFIDEKRISQVMRNLLNNAIKFSGKNKNISIKTWGDEKFVYVKVSDEGVGLSKKDMGNLFKPFSQVSPSYKLKEKGTGLGLAICKGIIEQHGGKIWVESEGLGKGSSFVFTISIKKPKV